jgi:hypothetical protein
VADVKKILRKDIAFFKRLLRRQSSWTKLPTTSTCATTRETSRKSGMDVMIACILEIRDKKLPQILSKLNKMQIYIFNEDLTEMKLLLAISLNLKRTK